MPRRVVHHNWVYQTLRPGLWSEGHESERQKRIRIAVRRELEKLPEDEREFIELYWFEGESIPEIAKLLGKKPYKLESLNKRIIRKLKNRLARFVKNEFKLDSRIRKKCPICDHPEIARINEILRSKKPEETYRSVIRILCEEFGINIKTPQTIIGHIRYHTGEEL